jgi:uncharacterized protein (TIGR03067 family)
MDAAAFRGSQIVIKDKSFKSLSMGTAYAGTIEINETKNPKTIDLIFTAGPPKGTRNLGIYKLDGGEWTLCLATRGGRRPMTFATKPDTGLVLETFERTTAVKKGPRRPLSSHAGERDLRGLMTPATIRLESSAPPTPLEGDWNMVEGVFNGVPLASSMARWCNRITRGDLTTVVAGPQVMLKARFTLDSRSRPNAIDYVNLEGSNARKTQAGIVVIDDGLLKICMAAPGKLRPATFGSKPGDGRSFTTWIKSSIK